MRNGGYFRMPAVNGDRVVFVCEDDLWTVPLMGGVARRLTAGLGSVARPSLSKDGTLLAFTSTEEHHAEVWCMPADGGPARRMTFFGSMSVVRKWTPDGRIVFTSDHGKPLRGLPDLYAISPAGGQAERLPVGPADDIAFGPAGQMVIGRNTADPARWKRYRGGMTGHLWVDAKGSGSFRRLPHTQGNVASPMWIGGRIWFLSDHEGVANLYSCTPTGRGLRRHTDHSDYYARFAGTDGMWIVYQHAADLWRLRVGDETPSMIDVDFPSPRTQRARRFVDAARFLDGVDVHPDGRALAVTSRGKLFTMPLWEEAVRPHGEPDGVRYRLARWLRDGTRVVVVCDQSGEERLEVHGPDGAATLDDIDLGRPVDVCVSPASDLLAVTNHRLELHLVDLETRTSRQVDASRQAAEGIIHPAWSADGAWLAYSFPETAQTRCIKIFEVASGTAFRITEPSFRDLSPSFDPDGRHLSFLSFRTLDPVYDSMFFDLGFPKGARPYLVTLRSADGSPFRPEPRGLGKHADGEDRSEDGVAEDAAGGGTRAAGRRAAKRSSPDAAPPVRIDVDGIERRVVAYPVPEGLYEKLRVIKGKTLLLSAPVEGSLGESAVGDEDSDEKTVEVFDFREQRHDTLISGVNGFWVSADHGTLVYRRGRRLRAVKAGEKPTESGDDAAPSRRNGRIDLRRIRVSVDPGAEWTQMLKETWRLQRDNFWVEDMSRVDWRRVWDRYAPLVDKVCTRAEFSDLVWEMQGELGTSHAYELGGDHRRPPPYAVGHLAADLEADRQGRLRFAHIVQGDSWDPQADSPLNAPGVNVKPGDRLLAINGRAVDATTPVGSLLVHQAGLDVELTVADGRGRNRRTVVVRTLRNEKPARYREWVETNRRAVHEATGGRAGYVHIPDMGAWGYSEFHRSYFAEVARDALVVDVRSNGGGHVSQLLLEKLARKRIGYVSARWVAVPEPYPLDSIGGPLVCITDEFAGSDGDIFTHGFKLLGLGPVVGKRTWGGVIGIWARHALVDGSIVTQPEFAYWFVDVGWDVENYGTDPDYDVDVRPQDYEADRDPQLEKALQLVNRGLRSYKPRLPDPASGPDRSLPTQRT